MEVTVYRLGLALAAVLAIVAGILVGRAGYSSFRTDAPTGYSILTMLVAEAFLVMGALIASSLAIGKPWIIQ